MKTRQPHPKNDNDFLSRHHCYPLERFKKGNCPKVKHRHLILNLWRSRHSYWHCLLANATIDEVIHRLCFDPHIVHNKWYPKVFKYEPSKAVAILKRFKRIKTRKSWIKKLH